MVSLAAGWAGLGSGRRRWDDDCAGDVRLLEDPIALDLLQSRQLVRLSWTWHDGTPRVVPLWFQWTGTTIAFWDTDWGTETEGA